MRGNVGADWRPPQNKNLGLVYHCIQGLREHLGNIQMAALARMPLRCVGNDFAFAASNGILFI
jgi:hypothetical protein